MLKAPFPWFGGKSRAAHLIWEALGNPPNYVEPFFGSGAALLLRPDYDSFEHTETINDKDCYVSNFWRALQFAPDEVAYYADCPVNEADLHARHLWLVNQIEFREQMMTDPDFYSSKIAGWWVWGLCQWIGSGWCHNVFPLVVEDDDLGNNGRGVHRQLPHLGDNGMGVHRKRPHLGNNGRGVHRQLPHLGDNGMGVHRKRPHLGNNGRGVHRKRPHLQSEPIGSRALTEDKASPASSSGGQRHGGASQASDRSIYTPHLYEYFEALAHRLRRVRVCCGDWSRILGPSPTMKIGITGVLLDPPYEQKLRNSTLYSVESEVSAKVREWAIVNGDNPMLRIALCGYSDEHGEDMPDSWRCVEWKAGGGYDGQKRDKSNQNRAKERIWFSPHCIKPAVREQLSLFAVS